VTLEFVTGGGSCFSFVLDFGALAFVDLAFEGELFALVREEARVVLAMMMMPKDEDNSGK